MTAPDRIPCSVAGCRRTAARDRYPDGDEIICGHHFRMASKAARDHYKVHRRAELRQQPPATCIGDDVVFTCKATGVTAPVTCDCGGHTWRRIVREATEAQAGLA